MDTANTRTMVQNSLMLGHLIILYPTSSRVSERASKRMSAAECTSVMSIAEQANE